MHLPSAKTAADLVAMQRQAATIQPPESYAACTLRGLQFNVLALDNGDRVLSFRRKDGRPLFGVDAIELPLDAAPARQIGRALAGMPEQPEPATFAGDEA